MPWPSCRENAQSVISFSSRIIRRPTATLDSFCLSLSPAFPALLRAIAQEKNRFEGILAENRFDLIISDNRMSVYSNKVPSYFISHQLRFSMPRYLYPFEVMTMPFNSFFHSKFEGVIVPDINPNGCSNNLSGKLCRSNVNATNRRVYYAGILTSTKKMAVDKDLDFLAIASGPEPQRTRLEEIILKPDTKAARREGGPPGKPTKGVS